MPFPRTRAPRRSRLAMAGSYFPTCTSSRCFWPVALALLAYLCMVQIRSAMQESATVDEPLHLASGYRYLKTGDFRMEPVHPPLAKMFAALPLLRFGLVPPRDAAPRLPGDQSAWATQWLAANARKEDGMLLAARLTSVFLTSCLGLAIALWTRASFGASAALLALTLYAFDPNIAAHGHYVNNDVPFTLCAFLACIAFATYLQRPSLPRVPLAALAMGVAMSTKLSASSSSRCSFSCTPSGAGRDTRLLGCGRASSRSPRLWRSVAWSSS